MRRTVCDVQCTVYTINIVRCTFYSVRRRTVYCTLRNVQCVLYDVYCTMCNVRVYCTMCNVRGVLYYVYYTMCNVRRTLTREDYPTSIIHCLSPSYQLQGIVYNVHCTVYNV